MEKRQFLGEMLQKKPKEVENLKEKVMPNLDKTKCGGKTIENVESICCSNEKNKFRNYSDRYKSIFLELFYWFSNFASFLQIKGNGGKPSRSET